MKHYCQRTFLGAGNLEAYWIPVSEIRKLAGLSRLQMSRVLHCGQSTLFEWERRRRGWKRGSAHAWQIYLAYLRPDPSTGWIRAALGLPPTGEIPAEAAHQVAHDAPGFIQVVGHKRRWRKGDSVKETIKIPQRLRFVRVRHRGHGNKLRGLWRRGKRFYAQMRVESGGKVRRVPLAAMTVPDAIKEHRALKERREERKRGRSASVPRKSTAGQPTTLPSQPDAQNPQAPAEPGSAAV